MGDTRFIREYRATHGEDKELPCLDCTDAQITACSNLAPKDFDKMGCSRFKRYERGDKSSKSAYLSRAERRAKKEN